MREKLKFKSWLLKFKIELERDPKLSLNWGKNAKSSLLLSEPKLGNNEPNEMLRDCREPPKPAPASDGLAAPDLGS